MAEAFDQIVIAVPQLSSAREEYATLLGVSPVNMPGKEHQDCICIPLANTLITLRQRNVDAAVIEGIVLRDSRAGEVVEAIANPLKLCVGVCNGGAGEILPGRSADISVDHLVLRTDNADACIEFFAGKMGVRLALDKTVPQWGGRMLFFRAGKMTLEVVQSQSEEPGESFFWGIAYQHRDIDALCATLQQRGVSLSSARDGRKPGTRVATVKSHCLGIPTLLIQPAPQENGPGVMSITGAQ